MKLDKRAQLEVYATTLADLTKAIAEQANEMNHELMLEGTDDGHLSLYCDIANDYAEKVLEMIMELSEKNGGDNGQDQNDNRLRSCGRQRPKKDTEVVGDGIADI